MLNVSTWIIYLILGVIEGITEFLPISSTGHIILIESILNCIDDSIKIFTVIVQSGAILSVLVVFWDRIYNISINCSKNIFFKQHYNNNHLCIQHICIGTVPGIIIGIFFYEKIRLLLFEPKNIIYGLIMGGVFLLISEWSLLKSSLNRTSNIANLTYFQAFLIGCFQCLAFWPGFSRSGSTIGGGLLVGLNRRIASEFSFFLAIPIVLGSTVLTVYHHRTDINSINIFMVVVGCATAFIIALFTVKFFLRIIQNISLIPFAIYRLLLAIIIYWELMRI